jgi:ribosomal protein S27AE
MIKERRTPQCSRCAVGLVQEFDLASETEIADNQQSIEERWVCPRCNASRPVVYVVSRSLRGVR